MLYGKNDVRNHLLGSNIPTFFGLGSSLPAILNLRARRAVFFALLQACGQQQVPYLSLSSFPFPFLLPHSLSSLPFRKQILAATILGVTARDSDPERGIRIQEEGGQDQIVAARISSWTAKREPNRCRQDFKLKGKERE